MYRKLRRGIKCPCAICGKPTQYKSKDIGYKCYNLNCESRKINYNAIVTHYKANIDTKKKGDI